MSLLSITKALENRVAALSGVIQTAHENVPFEPTENVPYQSILIVPSRPVNPTFGDSYHREEGIMRIRLFYPARSGKGAALTYAESLKDWFYRGLSLTQDGVTVIIRRTPSISTGAVNADRYVLAVDIQYFASVY